jgi:hypothetical protein
MSEERSIRGQYQNFFGDRQMEKRQAGCGRMA